MKNISVRSTRVIALLVTPLIMLGSSVVQAAESTPRAVVKISPTENSTVAGVLTIDSDAKGVLFHGRIQGLTPGLHGIHVHNFGDCTAPDGDSAGPHYNPHDSAHGAPSAEHRHAGDLGNLTADANGVAEFSQVIPGATVTEFVGRSVIVHEKQDDFQTQPTGNSGKRLACGVVGIAK